MRSVLFLFEASPVILLFPSSVILLVLCCYIAGFVIWHSLRFHTHTHTDIYIYIYIKRGDFCDLAVFEKILKVMEEKGEVFSLGGGNDIMETGINGVYFSPEYDLITSPLTSHHPQLCR